VEPRFARIADVPRGVVASLAQDRTGFIWFGGGNGLTRFDGQRLRIVDREADSLARRNLGWVRALLASEDGRLWIGTEADGIAVHDPATGRTHDVPYDLPGDTSASPGVKALPPTVLALASNGAGGLWAGTAGGGLQHYAARAPLLQRDATAFAGPEMPGGANDRVHALLRAQDGTLWLGSERGLARLPRGASQLEVLALPPRPAEAGAPAADPVQALRQMADGRIWIGTLSGRLAVAAGDGRTLAVARRRQHPGAGRTGHRPGARPRRHRVGRPRHRHRPARAGRRPPAAQIGPRPATTARPGGQRGDCPAARRAGSVWVGGLGLGLQRHDPGNRAMQWREADIGADGAGGAFADADVRACCSIPTAACGQQRAAAAWCASMRGSARPNHCRNSASQQPR
jgi:ligand-binding sensor domain-containing protein